MIIQSKRGNTYYYDNRTGQIIYVSDESEVNAIKNKYILLKESKKNKSIVTKDKLKKYLFDDGNGFKQLILEITTGCNFRCKYCIYSEYYPNTRTHGMDVMDLNVAKRAIDYYFENFKEVLKRNPIKQPIISFYGGEPLLHFKRLKEIVEYINNEYKDFETEYNLTTNGLLFNEEAQEFLMKNRFNILISLDGYKENHDRNRVDAKGDVTFDRVIENINKFVNKYSTGRTSISVCFDYKTDLRKMEKFFDDFPLIVTNIAQIQCTNSTYYEQFSEEDRNIMMESYQSIKNDFFKQVENGTIKKDSFLYRYFGSMYGEFAYHPMGFEVEPEIRPYTGTCIPGEKLYVGVDGQLKICEKINSSFVIGSLDGGLDYSAISDVLNKYNEVLYNKCEKCQISRLCKMCFKDFDCSKGFSKDYNICVQNKVKLEGMLKDFVDLMEIDPVLFEEITSDYYNFVSKVGELV